MSNFKLLFVFGILLLQLADLQVLSVLNADYPYCFSFTWIGPYAYKENILTETCDNRLGTYHDIPCQMPLVATTNDNVPDTDAMWLNKTRYGYACAMEPGWSCVKYSYIFKGGIQNITYMCAKVNATNGCYRQSLISGMDVEACVCTSKSGLIPCNQAIRLHTHTIYTILGLACVNVIFKYCKKIS